MKEELTETNETSLAVKTRAQKQVMDQQQGETMTSNEEATADEEEVIEDHGELIGDELLG